MNEKQKVIYEIQDYLRNISSYNENIPFVVSDGIYGEETTEAIKIFQGEYGLTQSGITDFETFTRLVEINREAAKQLSPPLFSPVGLPNALPLKYGDKGLFVRQLKLMLSFISERFSNFPPPTNYELFDAETEKQIMRWQRISALPETGIADADTWNSLSLFYLV